MNYVSFRDTVQKYLPRQNAYNWWVGISALWCRYLDSNLEFNLWWHTSGKSFPRELMPYVRA